jgi:hypothetical protein
MDLKCLHTPQGPEPNFCYQIRLVQFVEWSRALQTNKRCVEHYAHESCLHSQYLINIKLVYRIQVCSEVNDQDVVSNLTSMRLRSSSL